MADPFQQLNAILWREDFNGLTENEIKQNK